ncbi:TRAF family member-associated NF-kappa-B activator-like isoform X1 [Cuculus canorus]|uniref:TRAF family member-associated NF-kappa-B activator-like isoform X1 n=1 Tax=Cuculus canorus TaxID=55661 RepID=UPI0023AA9C95|nr:TRAF family member-associated NF-kappa-B activator-like isoform X1 [Cuculus canorus]
MSHRGRPAGLDRAPHHSMMEMEEIFLQLRGEVARLQDLCIKQGKLLQKLTARKGPILDIPVSLPIQCTEDMVMEEGERPLDSHQKHSEAPSSTISTTMCSAQTPVQPHTLDTLPGFDSECPPGTTNSSIFGGVTGGAALTVAFGTKKAERSEKVSIDTWLKTCRMLPTVKAPREEVRACCHPQESAAPNPVVGDAFLTLLDLYEAPEAFRREDAPGETALPAEAEVSVEIRGPVKTSWTPGWMLEDGTLGQGAVLALEDAQACDICQEIFHLDAEGQADYLKHVLAHMK